MSEALIKINNLSKMFPVKGNRLLHAVDDVTLEIQQGETLGLVGESGCGKSTVGKLVVGLLPQTSGEILFHDRNIYGSGKKIPKDIRLKMQIVFQDPYSSLNPRKTVKSILADPFVVNKIARGAELEEKVQRLARITGLTEEYLSKYPHELDGGKRQTVGIARSLALNPEFVVCDEPVSALDVSIQAQIINLLMDLQEEMHLTYLFISHDLSVVRHLSRRIAVMYLGKVMELCDKEELFQNPVHPYTQALLSAVPSVQVGRKKDRILLKGDVPSPINPKPGCRFCGRCWKAMSECSQSDPPLKEISPGHKVACFLCK